MKAIIFDLDDTLHQERRWLLSGLAAVASEVEARWLLDGRDIFRFLVGVVRSGRRGRALQEMCRYFKLPDELIPDLIAIIRNHNPRLRLSPQIRRTVASLRTEWRVGVLTNGRPAVQARKVAALGLQSIVDAVVYADLYGSKPTYLPFLMVADRLDVEPANCVFVGNDPWCDIYGARRVGMRTVQFVRPGHPSALVGPRPDAVVERLVDVRNVADRLIQGEFDDVVDDLRACG